MAQNPRLSYSENKKALTKIEEILDPCGSYFKQMKKKTNEVTNENKD